MNKDEECDYWRELYFKLIREQENSSIEKVKIKISKMNLHPGDVVAITAPGMISLEMAKQLKDHFEKYLPGVKAFIMGDGMEIEKVRHDAQIL